mgnify:CR=1 FL=1
MIPIFVMIKNRKYAGDIQILWFTALKIAEKIANLQKECEYEKLFANQSEKVKENFINKEK